MATRYTCSRVNPWANLLKTEVKNRAVHNSDSDICPSKFFHLSEFFFMKTSLFVHGGTVFNSKLYQGNMCDPRSLSDW